MINLSSSAMVLPEPLSIEQNLARKSICERLVVFLQGFMQNYAVFERMNSIKYWLNRIMYPARRVSSDHGPDDGDIRYDLFLFSIRNFLLLLDNIDYSLV